MGTPAEGQHQEKKEVGICVKVSAVVSSRHSVNLPPHTHTQKKSLFEKGLL